MFFTVLITFLITFFVMFLLHFIFSILPAPSVKYKYQNGTFSTQASSCPSQRPFLQNTNKSFEWFVGSVKQEK